MKSLCLRVVRAHRRKDIQATPGAERRKTDRHTTWVVLCAKEEREESLAGKDTSSAYELASLLALEERKLRAPDIKEGLRACKAVRLI